MPEAAGRWWFRWSLISPALVLAGAGFAQLLGVTRIVPAARPHHLAQVIPSEINGWTWRDLPLGANEFMNGQVEKILNYDECLNREYNQGGLNFGIYLAYWGPGKMPTRLVASHTPDRCWTENGWRCLEMKFKQTRQLGDATLQPAEWRSFAPSTGGRPTYVLYWHLVEGQVYDYGERFNAVPDPVRWWKDAVQQVYLGSREQYFIRITSTVPFENLWQDPGFREVLNGLSRLGILASSPLVNTKLTTR